MIKQSAGGAIAFSLTTSTDTPGGDPTSGVTNFSGLSMNEFAGNAISGDVNFGQGDGANVIPFDPTQWHEFWITIEKDEAEVGTHIASIYIDGNTTPQVFKMTAGPGSDFDGSYIAMGATATPQNAALDVDFYRIKFGAVPPEGASASPPPNFSDVSPAIGAGFVAPDAGVTFTATSEGSIPRENIQVILNGQDLSANLEITGNEQSWSVKLTGLQANSIYDGTLVITDSNGIPITGILSFNTFSTDNLTFEAENFNFDNGGFIDNATIQGGNSYFDKGGSTDSEGVDFHELSDEFDFDGNPDAWRFPLAGNMPNTVTNDNEAGRDAYTDFPDLDFSVNGTQVDEWLNFTRTFSVGDANVYLRSTDGGSYAVQLDRVTSNAGAADQTTESLGWFRSDGARGGNYEWLVLSDSAGSIASINLSGEVTLRATIVEGSPDLNFFMVTPAVEVIAPEPEPEPEPVTPSVSISRNDDGTVTVEFVGILQAANNVEGPYVDVATESPLTLAPDEAMQFARARQP